MTQPIHRFTPLHSIIPAKPLSNFRGPNGEKVIVSMAWHVDAEAGVLAANLAPATHLTALSESAFGIRTLPRIIEMHRELGVPATFFVPGYVCDTYPREIAAIAEAGFEISHHGYLHENCFALNVAQQREVFVKGIEAIQRITGKPPAGWSAPSWGMTPDTLDLLIELGFLYDSSLMEYDTPYVLHAPRGTLLELPGSMVLDDWEIFGGSPYPGGGVNAPAEDAFQVWKEEFDGMRHYGGFYTTSFHPNLTGRAGRLRMIHRLLEHMLQAGDVWFATCEAVAKYAVTTIKD